jgi:tryptophan halogenase
MKIVVVGGGTSGWSVAARLSLMKDSEVIVIEPSDIPRIGVGESTIPYINKFHIQSNLPFYDKEWLNEVDGVFKFGIIFDNYFRENDSWFHPFTNGIMHFNSFFKDDYSVIQEICSSNNVELETTQTNFVLNNFKFPKKILENGFNELDDFLISNGYAGYHIDAVKYANLLRAQCLARNNITVNNESVLEIVLDEAGAVKELVMSDGQIITGDLYIDCTGFSSIFAEKLENEWVSYQDRLFVDTAIVAQLPFIDKETQLRNYTYCHALDGGWCWNIPLQSRVGVGYNFSSRHITREHAEKEFKEHLQDYYGYDPETITFRTVPYKTGHRKEAWKKNVVFLGLSGFFLEPIESTAIATLHNLSVNLSDIFSLDHINEDRKRMRFNDIFRQSLNSTAEYVELHYNLTSRDDTSFWREYKSQPLSDLQKKILIDYADETRKYDANTVRMWADTFNMFTYVSYFFLFMGAGIMPNCGLDKIKQYLYK